MIEKQHYAGVSFSAANPLKSLFPPAPRLFQGGSWAGFFRIDLPMPLPDHVAPLFGSRWIVVALNRYLDDTLRYDELIIGQIVRIGWRIGLYILHIWVDTSVLLEGGKRILAFAQALHRLNGREPTVRSQMQLVRSRPCV